MLTKEEIDVNEVTADQHLTKSDKDLLERITIESRGMQETIFEHGYTGPIGTDDVHAISGTLMLSIASKRLLYLKEFKKGMDYHGLFVVLKNNVDLLKELFAVNQDKVCLLRPQFSEKGSSNPAVTFALKTILKHACL